MGLLVGLLYQLVCSVVHFQHTVHDIRLLYEAGERVTVKVVTKAKQVLGRRVDHEQPPDGPRGDPPEPGAVPADTTKVEHE